MLPQNFKQMRKNDAHCHLFDFLTETKNLNMWFSFHLFLHFSNYSYRGYRLYDRPLVSRIRQWLEYFYTDFVCLYYLKMNRLFILKSKIRHIKWNRHIKNSQFQHSLSTNPMQKKGYHRFIFWPTKSHQKNFNSIFLFSG